MLLSRKALPTCHATFERSTVLGLWANGGSGVRCCPSPIDVGAPSSPPNSTIPLSAGVGSHSPQLAASPSRELHPAIAWEASTALASPRSEASPRTPPSSPTRALGQARRSASALRVYSRRRTQATPGTDDG